ncbi:MAG: ABC transporter permease subunit [Actinomycetota bacterium]|nr:ABC transporter permease subunit [Actinomycetota bacterium]
MSSSAELTARPFGAQGRRFTTVVNRVAERLGWPLFWAVLVVVLLVPTACFLVLAVSPRLFDQGSSWLTTTSFSQALSGVAGQGMLDSVGVGAAAAVAATAVATALAWVLQRTVVAGRRFWSVAIWAVLLMPSYLIAVGWQTVLDKGGILASLGLYSTTLRSLFFGPVGYTIVLALKGVPFAYFAVAAAMAGIGRSFEEAARVHGASRRTRMTTMASLLRPALFAAIIIVFAESIADFGTAVVIAPNAHFPVATYTLYTALASYPADFGVAAVIGWMLVASVAVALLLQRRLLARRSYTVLGGRTRPVTPVRLPPLRHLVAVTGVCAFFVAALGIPVLGAVVSSLLEPFHHLGLHGLTVGAYRGILSSSALGGPLDVSFKLALINAFATLLLAGVVARRLAAGRLDALSRVMDLTLLAAVALPGLVLAAGYIFAYNLPIVGTLGIHLYGTLWVLGMAYLAGALPSTSRILVGPMTQVQGSLLAAARVHGATTATAWRKGVLPLLAPSLVWAWLLTFATTFLELPASELLAPPGVKPVAVAIVQVLNKSDLFRGTALSVVALLIDLAMIVVVTVGFRLLAPKGWRKVGARVF